MPDVPSDTATPEGMIMIPPGVFMDLALFGTEIRLKQVSFHTTICALPTKMCQDDRRALEKAGVIFGDKVFGNNIFTYVTLPAGWEKVAMSHSMHSKLVDDKGRTRATMFVGAARYDRNTHLNATRRFHTDMDHGRRHEGVVVIPITDGDTTVFTTQEYPYKGTMYLSDDYWAQNRAATDEAKAWLEENYPKWEDPSAYWD